MANKSPAFVRLRKDYRHLKKDPEPFILAEPDPQNILNWHYCITGPPDTPYHEGVYHGLLKFPKEYPFKPPSIIMYTPSGRFQTSTRLCLSMSDYHPESWNPSWSVGTILTGLVSFMVGNESSVGTTESSDRSKKQFAEESFEWCRDKSSPRGRKFCELFEGFIEEHDVKQNKKIEAEMKKRAEKRSELRSENLNVGSSVENLENSENITENSGNNANPGQNELVQETVSSDYLTSSVLFAFFAFFAMYIVPMVTSRV